MDGKLYRKRENMSFWFSALLSPWAKQSIRATTSFSVQWEHFLNRLKVKLYCHDPLWKSWVFLRLQNGCPLLSNVLEEHSLYPFVNIPNWTPTQAAVAACCSLKGTESNNPAGHFFFFLSVSFLVLDGEPVQESSSGRRINSLCGRLLVRRQRAALTVWRGHSTNPVRALGCQHTALLWGANHSTPVSYLSKLQNSFGLTSSSWPAPLSNSSQMSTANQIETGEEKGELRWWNEKTAH